MNRHNDLVRLYEILDRIEQVSGGKQTLANCTGRMKWPRRGVYFFFENGEGRSDTGSGMRIVRVGTHAVSAGSRTTLWRRLAQHRGTSSGGGNHRGSIFRLLIGESIASQQAPDCPTTWGRNKSADATTRSLEAGLEREVSRVIGAMQFLVLPIDDEPAATSLRARIERNSIGLLSNYVGDTLDPPSDQWLGHSSNRDRVRASGLWNQNHVTEAYDPQFLNVVEMVVNQTRHA